jgi:DNA-binding transcriptional MerR regulator
MSIGEIAELSGVPITTLRYYERRGLIDPPARISGQRRFEPSVLVRLMVIRFCRIAGLRLDDIAVVVADRSPGRAMTRDVARRQIEAIDAQIDELAMARRMMASTLACTCPTVDRCDCGAMDDVVADLRRRMGR